MGRFKDAVASRVREAKFSSFKLEFVEQPVSEENPFGGDECVFRLDLGKRELADLGRAFPEYQWVPAPSNTGAAAPH